MKFRKDELNREAMRYCDDLRQRLDRQDIKLVAWNKRRFLIEVNSHRNMSRILHTLIAVGSLPLLT